MLNSSVTAVVDNESWCSVCDTEFIFCLTCSLSTYLFSKVLIEKKTELVACVTENRRCLCMRAEGVLFLFCLSCSAPLFVEGVQEINVSWCALWPDL